MTWPVTLSSAPCAESEKLGACWWALPELRSVPLDLFHERGADTRMSRTWSGVMDGSRSGVATPPARSALIVRSLKPQFLNRKYPPGLPLPRRALRICWTCQSKNAHRLLLRDRQSWITAVGCGTALWGSGQTQRTQGDRQAGRRIIACCATSHRKERIKLSAAR